MCQLFRMRVPHRVEAAACRSGSHMIRNHSRCTATANCLFAPYLSIYTLVALVSLYRPECNHLSVEYAFPIVTNQNLTSRSHLMCVINLSWPCSKGVIVSDQTSKLFLVDLAGSEQSRDADSDEAKAESKF